MNTGFCGWGIILRINGTHGTNGISRMKFDVIPWLRLGIFEGGPLALFFSRHYGGLNPHSIVSIDSIAPIDSWNLRFSFFP